MLYLFSLKLNDIAFGMISGSNMLHRVKNHAKTWLTKIDHIDVYTDPIQNDFLEEIIQHSDHSNITFHNSTINDEYAIGTEWDQKWNQAQSRHLPAIRNLYITNPNKKWYFICDDDTYVFPDNLLDFLSSKNESLDFIYGVHYEAIGFSIKFFHSQSPPFFLHGGAGYIIPNHIMSKLSREIEKCIFNFDLPFVGSDIRLAICLSYYVFPGHLMNGLIRSDNMAFHSDRPEMELAHMSDRSTPISYHHINTESRAVALMLSSTSTTQTGYFDWSHYSTKVVFVETLESRFIRFMWGYAFSSVTTNEWIYATSEPIPFYEKGIIHHFDQYFGNEKITVRYVCSDQAENGELWSIPDYDAENVAFAFKLKCPNEQPFKYTRAQNEPLHVVNETFDYS